MGYFNSNVVMLDQEYIRTPYASGWSTVDFSDIVPATGVEALILYAGSQGSGWPSVVKAYGSTDSFLDYRRCVYAIVKNNGGKVDYYKYQSAQQTKYRCSLVGYITNGCIMNTNASNLNVTSTGAWQLRSCNADYPHPSLVILQQYAPDRTTGIGVKKYRGDHSWTYHTYGGSFPFVHPMPVGQIACYRADAGTQFLYLGALD